MKSIPLPPFAHVPQPYSGPSAEEVLALRKEFLSPAIFHYYKKPIMIVEGKAQWLFDEKGRRYLDGIGGIVTVSCGHCHPHIVAAANRQNELLQHTTTIYLNPNIALYARDLAAKMPGRAEGRLPRQLGLRGQRPGAPHGAGLHRLLRHDRAAQRLPRRQPVHHGAHLAPHLEVQRAARLRRAARRPARPLPRAFTARTTPTPAASTPRTSRA
jgi:hypothetical protein